MSARIDDLIARAKHIAIETEAKRRGLELRRTSANEWHGPCPGCGGDDRFRINTVHQRFYCRHCNQKGGDVIALTMMIDACQFADALETLTGEERPKVERRPPKARPETYEQDQHRKAAWLWGQRRQVPGSPVERYLREARHYRGTIPATLGFLQARGEYPPAMIAAFAIPDEAIPDEDEIKTGVLCEPIGVTAVHITRLLPDGSDRERNGGAKIMIGRSIGTPIVLAPANDLLGMAVTEGIEDALTVHQATGLGAWAAGTAGRMPALAAAIPSYVETVTIYAHADPDGRKGAELLAEALVRRGIETFVQGLDR